MMLEAGFGTYLSQWGYTERPGNPTRDLIRVQEQTVQFFDRYRGKGVPEGCISLSVRLTFQAPDRTLTDADVQQAFDTILSALVREHGAAQR